MRRRRRKRFNPPAEVVHAVGQRQAPAASPGEGPPGPAARIPSRSPSPSEGTGGLLFLKQKLSSRCPPEGRQHLRGTASSGGSPSAVPSGVPPALPPLPPTAAARGCPGPGLARGAPGPPLSPARDSPLPAPLPKPNSLKFQPGRCGSGGKGGQGGSALTRTVPRHPAPLPARPAATYRQTLPLPLRNARRGGCAAPAVKRRHSNRHPGQGRARAGREGGCSSGAGRRDRRGRGVQHSGTPARLRAPGA